MGKATKCTYLTLQLATRISLGKNRARVSFSCDYEYVTSLFNNVRVLVEFDTKCT